MGSREYKSLETRQKISRTLKRLGIKPTIRWSAKGTKFSAEKLARFKVAMAKKWQPKRLHKNCLHCGRVFSVPMSLDRVMYCSRLCGNTSRRTKDSLCAMCNKEYSPSKVRLSKYCSKTCGRLAISGDRCHAWKGGITPVIRRIRASPEYKAWRKSVFERDNYTCVWCGLRSGQGKRVVLHADHIKPFAKFPALRFSLSNGRTLCISCHRQTDTYGYVKDN